MRPAAPAGYEDLAEVLTAALMQAASPAHDTRQPAPGVYEAKNEGQSE